MNVTCSNCKTVNSIPADRRERVFRCFRCGAFLPRPTETPGDTSEAVGLIGGAALGAAIGGPVGAVVGAVIGAILGRQAKGVG